jgi:uncharacterized RDD family membrane protein YckC
MLASPARRSICTARQTLQRTEYTGEMTAIARARAQRLLRRFYNAAMSITHQTDPLSLIAGPELPPRPYRCRRCRVVDMYPDRLPTGGARCEHCGETIRPADVLSYAPFGRRLLALLVDAILVGLIVGSVLLVGGLIADDVSPRDAENNITPQAVFWFSLACVIIILSMSMMYLLVCNARGKSVGKRFTGLTVVSAVTGYAPGIGDSLARTQAQYLTMLTLGVGYAMAFRHPRRQALHDRIANTIVIEV